MGLRPSCRSCRHCTPPGEAVLGWCHLRQLSIHPDLVADLWCHHWTARPPRLPSHSACGGAGGGAIGGNQQLSLVSVLDEI